MLFVCLFVFCLLLIYFLHYASPCIIYFPHKLIIHYGLNCIPLPEI